MPLREDIHHVLVISSGPIVIGQACEFDYSGTQACQVLKSENIRVTLINSNPATIMTDPQYADATYIEPITVEFIEKVIDDQEKNGYPIDSLLATLGGQTALNAAVKLHEAGILTKHNIRLIGADIDAISRCEDRQEFKKVVEQAGGKTVHSEECTTLAAAKKAAQEIGYPVVVRPSFTMGGLGSGIVYDEAALIRTVTTALNESTTRKVLIEESIIGWKEYELELMRDNKDNVIVVCGIENIDPVGVHTGDSMTVSPIMTLTDVEFEQLRDLAIKILRLIGVDTGGCNIQFAVNPQDGSIIVIEMNPRVSRSSALASKATGFPIAKIAAKLAIGYALDEIDNEITGKTPASFEPTLDYVVVKLPRFAFEKFPSADPILTTTMKSVGEVMAIGRTFAEALGKALRSLESTYPFLNQSAMQNMQDLLTLIKTPTAHRLHHIRAAFYHGATIEQVHQASHIDPWFLAEIAAIVNYEKTLADAQELTVPLIFGAKALGMSDKTIAHTRNTNENVIRKYRYDHGIHPVFKTVDTCAAEFPATTPYHYSTYSTDPERTTEIESGNHTRPKVIILGSGPNRIGQGIEFDYSCVHAATILSKHNFETVMINCNPETVSTDYDIADRLYFEPLALEDVLEVYHAEANNSTVKGIIVQLGGQTPLNIAQELADENLPILGTTPENIDRAENRQEFSTLLEDIGLRAPEYGIAYSVEEAQVIVQRTGFPVLIRPSYVLGGRGMQIVYDEESLVDYMNKADLLTGDHPILVDHFLEDAVEVDVDALCDGTDVYIAGILEHIEEAGIHSGDSASVLPPIGISASLIQEIKQATKQLARGLDVCGFLNVQFAIKDDILYVLEANPRASRTVPFVAKSTGVPIAAACSHILVGVPIAQLRSDKLLPETGDFDDILTKDSPICVKEAVLPFKRFVTKEGLVVDSLLGPEMKSTGEVMGIDKTFPLAFAKSQISAYGALPLGGAVVISVADKYKKGAVKIARDFAHLGFTIYATKGSAQYFRNENINCETVHKFSESTQEENVIDLIAHGKVDIVINIPSDRSGARTDGYKIRAAASAGDVISITTLSAAEALAAGIAALRANGAQVESLQSHQFIFS